MNCVRTVGCVLLTALFVLILPYAAHAGAIRIEPDQFRPAFPNDPNILRSSDGLAGDLGGAVYYARVNLPVGKRVTELTLYYYSIHVPTSGVDLHRIRFANYRDIMAGAWPTESTSDAVGAVSDTSINYPFVRGAQYAYYLWLFVGDGEWVSGVKVKYE